MNNRLWNISVQQVQIFLKAVEYKNFTQVANDFNFTPSMISKTISSLENELNLQLFTRKPRELTPTPAAILLSKEWRQFVASFQGSIDRASSLQNGQFSNIVFGFVDSSVTIDQMIMESVMEYKNSHPEITVTVEKHDMHRLAELLHHGLLDIILTSAIEIPYLEEHGLPWETAFETDVSVFIPKENPLFTCDSIDFDLIRNQPMLGLDAGMHPSYAQWLRSLCKSHGFTPDITASYRTVRSLLFSLKMGSHIFIGDSVTSDWCDDTLKCLTLPEKSFSLVARSRHAGKEIKEFQKYLIEKFPERY